MNWPTEIICHGAASERRFFQNMEYAWRPAEPQGRPTMMSQGNAWVEDPAAGGAPGPYGSPFRTCNYCGSINPEDLHRLATTVPTLTIGGSDWKYGWPHKFYIGGIPNPLAGQRVCDGGSYQGDHHTLHFGVGPEFTHAKWYNDHLHDITDQETFDVFAHLLEARAGIRFDRVDGHLRYSAPYDGYQR